MSKLLEVHNLRTRFLTAGGPVTAVNNISFSVNAGEVLGLVGESGCGKSITALSIMNLIEAPGFIETGKVLLNNSDLLSLSETDLQKIRGHEISMIFQEPMTSLNPVFSCGEQISDVIRLHKRINSNAEIKNLVIDLLRQVGIPDPEIRFDYYPHQLSGGMRQRVMLAMALSCSPKLLIADEPTTALDVTIQAQILDLIQSLQAKHNLGVILITHDLAVVSEICTHIAVMYSGKIIETGLVQNVFSNPQHPYTKGLLNSIPAFSNQKRLERLPTIPEATINSSSYTVGCHFYKRCDRAETDCTTYQPLLSPVKVADQSAHQVACLHR